MHEFKILLTNQHTDNRGDQAALYGVIMGIQKRVPQASFVVQGQWNEESMIQRSWLNASFGRMICRYGEVLVALTYGLLNKIGIRLSFLLKLRSGRKLKEFVDADIVVSQPGGPYIGEKYRGHEHVHLFHIWLGLALGKPTVLYSPSCGPFERPVRNKVRKSILNRLDFISVREEISAGYLRELGIPTDRINVFPDAALQYEFPALDADLAELVVKGRTHGRPIVGFTPSEHHFDKELLPGYLESLTFTLNKCLRDLDADVVAFPQLFGRHSDMPLIKKIIEGLEDPGRCHVFPDDRDCLDQQSMISSMDLMIATRYHSQIFASKGCVPSVCISYEHKSRGFMESLDLERFCIDIGEVTPEGLWELVRSCWDNRSDIRRHIETRMPEMAELSSRASVACADILTNGRKQD
jgi:colanic acid/amylovoran biosynthesis protein